MTHIETLIAQIKTNPAIVTELYPALVKEKLWALVAPDYTNLHTALFLTYDSKDVRELPLFTSTSFTLIEDLRLQSGALLVSFDAKPLLKRLLDMVDDETHIAINPGWEHGIRIDRPLLLSLNYLAEARH